MVTVKCDTFLKDLKGKDTTNTIGAFLSECLWNSRENQARAFMLATKFADDKTPEVELKAEDVVFIKKVITTLGARAGEAGQVLILLDGADKE